MTSDKTAKTMVRNRLGCEEGLPESMDTEYDFGNVLLIIEISQFKPKGLRKSNCTQSLEEGVDVFRMEKLVFGVLSEREAEEREKKNAD
jgi:hypothetical protein